MHPHADVLLDRQRLKRQLTRWKLVGVACILIVLAVIAGGRKDGLSLPTTPYIARYTLEGIITDDRDVLELLEEIRTDKQAKALILYVDSPGGTAVGGERLYTKLREIGVEKPVVTVMRTLATSAAYMAALGTDHIVASEATITASIGVLMESAEFTGMAEKLGVTPISVKSGTLKASPGPLEKASPEAIAAVKVVIMDFYDFFLRLVKERRGLNDTQIQAIADGRIVSGRQALELKLIDTLGGEAEALDWLVNERKIDGGLPVEDVEPEPAPGQWLERLGSSVNGMIRQQLPLSGGLMAVWKM